MQAGGPTLSPARRVAEADVLPTSPRFRGEVSVKRSLTEGEGLGECAPALLRLVTRPLTGPPPGLPGLELALTISKPGVGPPLPASGERNWPAQTRESNRRQVPP